MEPDSVSLSKANTGTSVHLFTNTQTEQTFTHGSLYSLLILGANASIASEEHISLLSSLEVNGKEPMISPSLSSGLFFLEAVLLPEDPPL